MPPDRATDHYVGRGVEQVIQAPYVAYNVRMLGCILPACPADLNETLTRHLNVTADGSLEFSTTIPYVLFYYAEVPYIGSATNSDKPLGGSPEREAAFVIFAQEKKSDKLYAYFPYMFVTVGSAMAAGREVYGFPKQLAKISAGTHGRLPAPRLTFWDRIRLWFAR